MFERGGVEEEGDAKLLRISHGERNLTQQQETNDNSHHSLSVRLRTAVAVRFLRVEVLRLWLLGFCCHSATTGQQTV